MIHTFFCRLHKGYGFDDVIPVNCNGTKTVTAKWVLDVSKKDHFRSFRQYNITFSMHTYYGDVKASTVVTTNQEIGNFSLSKLCFYFMKSNVSTKFESAVNMHA